MSTRFPLLTYIKRNRSSKTQITIFVAASLVSSLFIAGSSLSSVKAAQSPERNFARTSISLPTEVSPAVRSTLAPLEDSVETITKIANVPAATEKTQELLDKAKVIEVPAEPVVDKDLAEAVPVPDALHEVPDATTLELEAVPIIKQAAVAVVAAPAFAAASAPSIHIAAPVAATGSNYPYANAPFPNSIADPWGMYQRQCVSYAAWKVSSSGRNMPYWGGRGNASEWDDNARAAGIPVDGYPRVGDVAVSHAGGYGHVSYVEAVYGDGSILVSQYNARWNGAYSEERLSTAGLVFIHF